ncbi:MAG: cell division protein PerM [Actinomycetota bacterium]
MSVRKLLFRGWVRAAVSAVAIAIVVAALGELVSFVLFAAKVLPNETAGQAARQGFLLFYSFHHVPLQFRTPALQLPTVVNNVVGLPTGYAVNAYVDFGLMTGTVLALWLFARAGRTIASRVGGTPVEHAFHGAKIAVPYAVVCYVGSMYVELRQRFPQTSSFSVAPSEVAAIFWPFFLALIFGALGGVRSSDRIAAKEWLDWKMTTAWRLRWRGAFTGATTMLALGLGLSFAGLLVVAIFTPGPTSAFFRAIASNGVSSGIGIALTIALAIPNIAAWILVPAMGGCLQVGGGGTANAAPSPYCFLSYGNSPAHPLHASNQDWAFLGFHQLGPGSPWLLLFLVVPFLAAFIGGVRAVRAARANTPREALIVTTLTAVVFAALMTLTLVLAWVQLTTNGATLAAENYYRYGPYPSDGVQLAFGWSLLVGGLGAFWMQWRLKHAG